MDKVVCQKMNAKNIIINRLVKTRIFMINIVFGKHQMNSKKNVRILWVVKIYHQHYLRIMNVENKFNIAQLQIKVDVLNKKIIVITTLLKNNVFKVIIILNVFGKSSHNNVLRKSVKIKF